MPPKSYYASDLLGTMLGLYRVRNTTLKDNVDSLDIRNLDDTEYRSIHSDSSLVEDSLNSKEVSTTVTPGSGRRKLIAKNDGWYDVDDEGNVTKVGTGTGGGDMEEHGNEYHTSAFITLSDLPATYTPSSHGNEAHTSTFITSADLPATYVPSSHGNEAHSSTFITAADIPAIPDAQIQSDWNQDNNALLDYIKNKPTSMTPDSHGNEAHSSTFITSADIPASLPPDSHGNEAHSSTFITSADLPATYAPSSHGNDAHSSTFITAADLPTTYTPSSHGNEAHSSLFITAGDVHSNSNDPSSDEKAALAGTNGTPSATNKYVTNDDSRNTNARIPTSHGNEAHSSTFITSGDLPATYTPSSHGNEAHSSTFITSADLPVTYAPSSHGNEAHTNTFITAGDLPATYVPSSHGNEAHSSTFITADDIPTSLPPDFHASTHISTGDDPIADAVSEGASGLMSGADKFKLDSLQGQVQTDWNQASNLEVDYIKNKPTIPAAQVKSDWNAAGTIAEILNKPTIPAAQIQSDWNQASSGSLDYIKNKPSIPAAQVNADWNASGTVAEILNKPSTMPPSTHQHTALRETITQVSHGFAAKDCIRRSSGSWVKAQADSLANADVEGIVESVDGNDFVIIYPGGVITGLTGLTDATTYFLSAATAGAITSTDPSIADSTCVSKPVLNARSTTSGQVIGQRGVLQGPEVPDESVTNVRLVITNTNTMTLQGVDGTNKLITVNGESISLLSSLTLNTDSEAINKIVTGTTSVSEGSALGSYTGSSYNAHGLHHVYLANNSFSITGLRGKLFLSAEAGTSGYLAASGDGVNARHIGWVIVNSSRLMAYNTYLASRFNPLPATARVNANTDITDLNGAANPADWRDTDAVVYAIWPIGRKIEAEAQASVNNQHPDWTTLWVGISFDSTSKNTASLYAGNNSLGLLIGDVKHIHYGEVATSTTVVLVKLRVGAGVLGSAADPSFWALLSYIQATIEE